MRAYHSAATPPRSALKKRRDDYSNSTSASTPTSSRRVVFHHEIEIFEAERNSASKGLQPTKVVQDILETWGQHFSEWAAKFGLDRHSSPRTCIWHFVPEFSKASQNTETLDSLDFYIAAFARCVTGAGQ